MNNNKQISLPVYETFGLLLSAHNIYSESQDVKTGVIFNEDLLYFQIMLNANLRNKFGDKFGGKQFNVVSTFLPENGNEDEVINSRYKYKKSIKCSVLLQNTRNGLPPFNIVKSRYDENLFQKLESFNNPQLKELINSLFDERIENYPYNDKEDHVKSRYMYWFTKDEVFKNDPLSVLKESARGVVQVLCSQYEDFSKLTFQEKREVERNIAQVVHETLKQFEKRNFLSDNYKFVRQLIEDERKRVEESKNNEFAEEDQPTDE